jgi:3'(2'), 5'-bisphosphate nucleotidase
MLLESLIAALRAHLPGAVRWSGEIAKRLRHYNIALAGKSSGSSNTDALTIADLAVQELLVAALRDTGPILRQCRIEGEESTGDLAAFAADSAFVLAIDPIDGTKQYRDKSGSGYAVMLHLRSRDAVHYSLVFVPETGERGTWVEVFGDEVRCGPDNPAHAATTVLAAMPPIDPRRRPDSKKIYLIGFQERDVECARLVTAAGLEGVPPDVMPGSIYDLLARGDFGGSLIHTPNVYDFPVSLHIARVLGGDAVWVHNGQSVHFGETWLDDRADMLRLPGVVACSANRETLSTLCNLARDWDQRRYKS